MVIKTASPGIYLQEVDLTRGVVDPVSSNVAVCAGPFQRGPVDQLVSELRLKLNSEKSSVNPQMRTTNIGGRLITF